MKNLIKYIGLLIWVGLNACSQNKPEELDISTYLRDTKKFQGKTVTFSGTPLEPIGVPKKWSIWQVKTSNGEIAVLTKPNNTLPNKELIFTGKIREDGAIILTKIK